MPTIFSLPPEIVVRILALLAAESQTFPSFKALLLASAHFSRVYLANRNSLLRICIRTYLGPFLAPALALTRVEATPRDQLTGRKYLPHSEILELAAAEPDNLPNVPLSDLEHALETHKCLLANFKSSIKEYRVLRRGSELLALQEKVNEGMFKEEDLGVYAPVREYLRFIALGLNIPYHAPLMIRRCARRPRNYELSYPLPPLKMMPENITEMVASRYEPPHKRRAGQTMKVIQFSRVLPSLTSEVNSIMARLIEQIDCKTWQDIDPYGALNRTMIWASNSGLWEMREFFELDEECRKKYLWRMLQKDGIIGVDEYLKGMGYEIEDEGSQEKGKEDGVWEKIALM